MLSHLFVVLQRERERVDRMREKGGGWISIPFHHQALRWRRPLGKEVQPKWVEVTAFK